MYSKIPYELKELDRWVYWKFEKDKIGNPTKVPYNAKTGYKSSSIEPSTWSDFETAVEASKHFDGIGIMLGDGLVGIDLDDIEDDIIDYKNGNDENIVGEFVDQLNSYTELSPSGTGIHILVKGKLPEGRRKKQPVEMYETTRFFTVTGNAIGGFNHVADDTEINVLGRLHEKYLEDENIDFENVVPQDDNAGNRLSEDEVIARAEASIKGKRFKALFGGDWEQLYDSQSEADLALASDLGYWTGKDFNKMDSIFRRSKLYRKKWDTVHVNGQTYGHATLMRVIQSPSNVWQDPNELLIGSDDTNFTLNPEESKPHEVKFYSYDDSGNGERFERDWHKLVRFNHESDSWLFYNGRNWEFDSVGQARLLVNKTIDKMKYEPVSTFIDPETAEEKRSKHIAKTRSTASKNNMLTEAKSLLQVNLNEFDQDKTLMNVQNGYIDLKTGKLHEHDINKKFMKISPYEYTRNIDAPLWENFLRTVFDDNQALIDYIQRAVGYSLSGEIIEEKMFILEGNGRNGKSVFLGVIRKLLGDYTKNIQPESLMVSRTDANAPSDHIARLDGSRFVTSSEPNRGDKFDEGKIKYMTGTEEPITARFLNRGSFDFVPQFKIWLGTNYKPMVAGSDDGIWRRFSVIPFNVQIPEDKVDRQLSKKLELEMSGIMKWAVDGYAEWSRIGLAEPKEVQKEVDSYRFEMDIIELWIQEKCERNAEAFETNENLYASYKQWANDTNNWAMNKRMFDAETLEKLEFRRFSSKRGRVGLEIIKEDGHHYSDKIVKLDFDNTLKDRF